MKYLGKIEDNLDMVTKQYVDENGGSGGEDEVVIEGATPTEDFKIWIDTSEDYDGDVVNISSGGTGAKTADTARANLFATPYIDTSNQLTSGTLAASGSASYTATDDCYFRVTLIMQANSQGKFSMSINGVTFDSWTTAAIGINVIPYSVLLRKGDTVAMTQLSNYAGSYAAFGLK